MTTLPGPLTAYDPTFGPMPSMPFPLGPESAAGSDEDQAVKVSRVRQDTDMDGGRCGSGAATEIDRRGHVGVDDAHAIAVVNDIEPGGQAQVLPPDFPEWDDETRGSRVQQYGDSWPAVDQEVHQRKVVFHAQGDGNVNWVAGASGAVVAP